MSRGFVSEDGLIAQQSHKSEEAADSVNDNNDPLITDDNPFIPALCMAITKGDVAPVEEFRRSRGSFEGTSIVFSLARR